jgi:hypothetical protein
MAPPKNAQARLGPGLSAKLIDVDSTDYHGRFFAQVVAGWERHAEWLLARFQRSGKPGDWKAYVKHVAGMAQKLREAA